MAEKQRFREDERIRWRERERQICRHDKRIRRGEKERKTEIQRG